MRIGMIAHSEAPWTPFFLRFFTERGDHLLLISFSPGKLDVMEGSRVEYVGSQTRDLHGGKHRYIARVPRIRRCLRRFRAEVVFAPYLRSNGLTAVLASQVPVVVSAVGGDVLDIGVHGEWRRRVLERVVRFVCRRAALINPVSRQIEQELVRIGADPSKIMTQPFGAELQRFGQAADMPRPVASQIVCTRKHEPVYNIPTILRALARLQKSGREFHCTLAGGGSLLESHRQLAMELDLDERVSFTGHLPHADVAQLLTRSDIYISASLSDGTSVSLIEAIAAGILPVVSRIPANTPWVKHGQTGLLFDPADPADLAGALETALDNRELRGRACSESRLGVLRELDAQRNAQRLAVAMEKLIAEASR
ncbi:MAG: hypothetical protein AMXMBFR67_37240 [Nitrospira sp.]